MIPVRQDGLPTTARPRESKCYDAAEEAMATTTRKVATEEDLLAMPRDGHKYELVDGEIRVSPTGNRHGEVIAQLSALLFNFVKPRRLGHVISGDAGFRLPDKNVRCPDVSFVACGRFPDDKVPTTSGISRRTWRSKSFPLTTGRAMSSTRSASTSKRGCA